MRYTWTGIMVIGIASLSFPIVSLGHGFTGKRFFPSSLTVNDPFVSDELGIGVSRDPDTTSRPLTRRPQRTERTSFSFDLSKRLTKRLQISISDHFVYTTPPGAKQRAGLGNVVLGLRLQGPVRADAQAAVSAGLNVEIGGSGSQAINHDSWTTLSPTFNFVQGFGNLPGTVKYLRPLALTGSIAWNYPTRSSAPRTLDTGFTIQYSLSYLQSMLARDSLPPFIRNLSPIVEFPFEVCLNNGCGGTLAGSINPGLIWATNYGQIGMEAMIPVNRRSGEDVGGILELRVFFDRLLPNTLGKPLFGRLLNKPINESY